MTPKADYVSMLSNPERALDSVPSHCSHGSDIFDSYYDNDEGQRPMQRGGVRPQSCTHNHYDTRISFYDFGYDRHIKCVVEIDLNLLSTISTRIISGTRIFTCRLDLCDPITYDAIDARDSHFLITMMKHRTTCNDKGTDLGESSPLQEPRNKRNEPEKPHKAATRAAKETRGDERPSLCCLWGASAFSGGKDSIGPPAAAHPPPYHRF